MITINFYVEKANDPKSTACIMCQIRYKAGGVNERLRFSSGEKCLKSQFRDQKVYHTVKFASQINGRLNFIRARAEEVYRLALDGGEMPTVGKFKEMILQKTAREVVVERSFMNDFRLFIEYHEARGTSRGSLSHVKMLEKLLILFEKKSGHRLDYSQINLLFYGRFLKFLSEQKLADGGNYAVNSKGNFVKKLKMFLNWSRGNGWNKFEFYKNAEFKIPTEAVQNVYLSQSELVKIAEIDLARRPGLAAVRDWFLLACEIGMRYSDYDQLLLSENIRRVVEGWNFYYFPKKTARSSGVRVVAPLTMRAVEILERYGFALPAPISNQKMNDALKELARLAGSEKVIATHTARRTFATNAYLDGLPTQFIMKITGHKTEQEFRKYLCLDGEENADLVRQSSERFRLKA